MRKVPKKEDDLVMTVPEAGKMLRLGRNAAYDAAQRGDIPTIKIGKLLRVGAMPIHPKVERFQSAESLQWLDSSAP